MDVKKIAKLSAIPLTSNEEEELGLQLSQTADYVKVLDELDVSKVEPTSQVNHKINVTRVDEIAPSLSQEQALSGTQNSHLGFFKTSATINKNQ